MCTSQIVVFTADYSHYIIGDEAEFSFDIAQMLIEQGVAVLKPEPPPPVLKSRSGKPSKFGQKPELDIDNDQ